MFVGGIGLVTCGSPVDSGILGQPTWRKLSCLLARVVKVVGGGAQCFVSLWRSYRVGCSIEWLLTHLLDLSVF